MLTPNHRISLNVLAHIRAGKSPAQAIDAVLGAGTYATLAGNLYDALKGK
jgi:hypothetical protein